MSKSEINTIIKLRNKGHSLNEIKDVVNRGYGTVYKYIKGVPILKEYEENWKVKRGGSRARSIREWENSKAQASNILKSFDYKDKMIILACLYWGEGNKTELNIINSDPDLIRVTVSCLIDLGVSNDDIKFGLRLFEDINKSIAVKFWADKLGISPKRISYFEIKNGKKVGKLQYGMCRVRVKKGGKYFKIIMSMVDLIKSSVQIMPL